jgi:hypothetical protein
VTNLRSPDDGAREVGASESGRNLQRKWRDERGGRETRGESRAGIGEARLEVGDAVPSRRRRAGGGSTFRRRR